MTELEKYQVVNSCTSLPELASAINLLQNDKGEVEISHNRTMSAHIMVQTCLDFSEFNQNNLTRKYGIRQQAVMLNMQGNQ